MNKKKILILMGIILLLTGCIKYDLNMGVGTDKSISITIIDAIQNEYANTTETNTNLETYKKLGYDVEEYSDNTHTGLKLTKKFNSIDDISSNDYITFELTSLLNTNSNDLKLFKSEKDGTITTYIANFTYDLRIKETENDNQNIDYSEYSNTMIFSYTITLPKNSKVINDNADLKSNNDYTLTWNMKYGELKNINFAFEINDNDVTSTPKNDTNDDNEIMDNDDNQTNTIPPTNDNNKEEQTEQTNNESSKLSSSIIMLLLVVIILGFLVYKIKLKKDNKTPTTPMAHQQAPKR